MGHGLADAIHGFDGATDDLKAAAAVFAASDGETLGSYLGSPVAAHRVAASWIAKAVIESGRGGLLNLSAFFARLEGETAWEVQLHILQSVQHAPEAALSMRAVIGALRDHPRTLVAVWALDAWVRLVLATGDGLPEARRRVVTALSAPKASLRARARHLAPLLGL